MVVNFIRQNKPSLFATDILWLTLVLASLIFPGCNHLFYQPSDRVFHNHAKIGHTPQLVEFVNKKKAKLYGWYFKAKKLPVKGTVIHFHGNAENITSHFLFALWMVDEGYNVFVFDYSGYGMSGGEPSGENIRLDAEAAYSWVKRRVKGDERITLFAQSLGVAALVNVFPDLTEKNKIKAVILDSGFYSYQAIARDKLDAYWLSRPFQFLAYLLVSDEHTPEPFFSKISPVPALLIHGTRDVVVPFKHAENIFELLKEPKYFWPVNNGRHIGALRKRDGIYREKLLKFLDSLPRRRTPSAGAP